MTPAPQHDRATIAYDPRDHTFVLTIDGREIARAVSHLEAEHLEAAFFRAERALTQIKLPNDKLAMTVTEVARALGVRREVVAELVESGDLPAFRIEGTRNTLIPVRLLQNWIDDQAAAFRAASAPDASILAPRRYTRTSK